MKFSRTELIEIFGITTLVASLAFVGIQLWFDRQVALSDSYISTMNSRKENIRTKLESDAYMKMEETRWADGFRPNWWQAYLENGGNPEVESGSDIMVLYLDATLILFEIDSIFYQYDRGLIGDAYFEGTSRSLSGMLDDPLQRTAALEVAAPIKYVAEDLVVGNPSAAGT